MVSTGWVSQSRLRGGRATSLASAPAQAPAMLVARALPRARATAAGRYEARSRNHPLNSPGLTAFLYATLQILRPPGRSMQRATQPALAIPRLIGHRGAAAAAPENTLASLRKAKELGASWVEFDVKLTRDGHPVLIHDERLERTTSGRGEVALTTLVELQKLDAGGWFAPAFGASGCRPWRRRWCSAPGSVSGSTSRSSPARGARSRPRGSRWRLCAGTGRPTGRRR